MRPLTPLETKKLRRQQANAYSDLRGTDKWGMFVAWLVVSEGVVFARSMCLRYNKQSPAWRCYQNLLKAGLIVEGAEGGIVYDTTPKWEGDEGTYRWLEAVAHVAAGGKPDRDLPRRV